MAKDNIVFLNVCEEYVRKILCSLNERDYDFYFVPSLNAIKKLAKKKDLNLIIIEKNVSGVEKFDLLDFAEENFISLLVLDKGSENLHYVYHSTDINNREFLMYIIKTLCRVSWVSRHAEKRADEDISPQESYLRAIDLLDAIDEHSNEHSIKVVEYATKIGQKLNFNDKELTKLVNAALLHDVGKTIIPKQILASPDKLTKVQYEIIKLHSTILNNILPSEFDDIKIIIRHHHEKYDGSGYPDGLKGEDIPYLSRIITVIDSFDAMTSKRLYNKPITKEEGLEILKKDSGSHFDPEIVNIFVNIFE